MSENNSIFPMALRYGVFIGIVSILLQMITNLLMPNPLTMKSIGISLGVSVLGLAAFVVIICLMVYAVRKQRGEIQNGTITFGQVFGVAFIAYLIGSLMSLTYLWLYYSFIISPELLSDIQEARDLQIEAMDELGDNFMANWGKKQMAVIGNVGAQIKTGLMSTGIMGTIISLIIALAIKKDNTGIVETETT